jgi:hypothetical protein
MADRRLVRNRIGWTNASATQPEGCNPDHLRRRPQSVSDTARVCCCGGSERRACSQANSREPLLTRREQRKREGRSTDHKATRSALRASGAGAGGDTDVDGRDRGDKAGQGTSKAGPQHVAGGVVGCLGAAREAYVTKRVLSLSPTCSSRAPHARSRSRCVHALITSMGIVLSSMPTSTRQAQDHHHAKNNKRASQAPGDARVLGASSGLVVSVLSVYCLPPWPPSTKHRARAHISRPPRHPFCPPPRP